MKPKQLIASFLALSLAASLCACAKDAETNTATDSSSQSPVANAEEKAYIEETLNLSNNADLTWTYNADADDWVMSIVSAVAYGHRPGHQRRVPMPRPPGGSHPGPAQGVRHHDSCDASDQHLPYHQDGH